jgi:hypothetical protein
MNIQDNDISTVLFSLGFKNITEEQPIRLIDTLPYSFNNIYDVHSRWIRKFQDDIFSEILVGLNSFNRRFIDVIVVSVYGQCISKAYDHIYAMHSDWKNFLQKFISLNEQSVRNAFEAPENMYKEN